MKQALLAVLFGAAALFGWLSVPSQPEAVPVRHVPALKKKAALPVTKPVRLGTVPSESAWNTG